MIDCTMAGVVVSECTVIAFPSTITHTSLSQQQIRKDVDEFWQKYGKGSSVLEPCFPARF